MSILSALQARHKDDLFLAEVKDGATQTRNHRRLDGWALLRTWSPVTTIGYEFKNSRADWLQDRKWESYLPLVHQFYVCAPKGIVQIGELPESVGLMELVGKDRLVTRRKAARREIDLPTNLLLYVLMARVAPSLERVDRALFWQQWLQKDAHEQLQGRAVSRRIRDLLDDANRRARQAEHKVSACATVEETLKKLGLDPERILSNQWSAEREITLSLNGCKEALNAISAAQTELTRARAELLRRARGEVPA